MSDVIEELRIKSLYIAKSVHELKNVFLSINSSVNLPESSILSTIKRNSSFFLKTLCDYGMFLIKDITNVSKLNYNLSNNIKNNHNSDCCSVNCGNNNNKNNNNSKLKSTFSMNTNNNKINKLYKTYTSINIYKDESENIPFKLRNVLKFCINIFKIRSFSDKKDLIFKINIDPELKRKTINNVNEFRLKQVIINLLSNAYKFTLKGYINIDCYCIHVNEGTEKKKIVIKISDSGLGFNNDDLKDIFSPFQMNKKHLALNETGSGLGLYIVKEICESFNSKIEYNSVKGKGSEFWFTLNDDESSVIDQSLIFTDKLKQMIQEINNGTKDTNQNFNYDEEEEMEEEYENEEEEFISEDKNNVSENTNINNHSKKATEIISKLHNNNILPQNTENVEKKMDDINLNFPLMKKNSIIKQTLAKSKSFETKIEVKNNLKLVNKNLFKRYSNNINTRKRVALYAKITAAQSINSLNSTGKLKRFCTQMNFSKYKEKKKKILICDDEIVTALSTRNILNRYFNKCMNKHVHSNNNFIPEILFVQNGIECIYKIYNCLVEGQEIDTVLIDENMPFLNGEKTCKFIKNIYEFQETKIYIISSEYIDVTKCKANGFYNKPLNIKNVEEIFKNS